MREEKNSGVWVIDNTPDYIQIKAEGSGGSVIMLDLTPKQANDVAIALLMCLDGEEL